MATIVPKKTSKFIFNDLVQHKPSLDDLLPSKNLSSPEKPVLTQKIKEVDNLLSPSPQKLLDSQLSHPTIPGEPDIQFSKKYAPSPRKEDNDASKAGGISNPEAFNSQKSHRKFTQLHKIIETKNDESVLDEDTVSMADDTNMKLNPDEFADDIEANALGVQRRGSLPGKIIGKLQ
jgi:hypothetical protein